MKSLATLDPDSAVGLVEHLRNAGIACQSQVAIEESGIPVAELLVEDTQYDTACDLVDKWLDDVAREARMICPTCRSPHLERVPHDSVEVLFKCKDCGSEILAQT